MKKLWEFESYPCWERVRVKEAQAAQTQTEASADKASRQALRGAFL